LVGNNGGCELLIQILLTHDMSHEIAEQCCRAVNALILEHSDNQIRMMGCDAVPTIIKTIQKHLDSANAVNRASCALFNLTVENETCREQCWSTDGCAILNNALLAHVGNEPVCVRVALTIKTLTFDVEGQNRLGEAGACKSLIKALTTHEGSVSATPLILSAISSICLGNTANQNKTQLINGCLAVVSTTQRHIGDVSILLEGCRAILSIGHNNDDAKAKLASAGAVELCNNILSDRLKFNRSNNSKDEEASDEEVELIDLANSCKQLLATQAPSSFFTRRFSFLSMS
jgi:hypothetical protein